MSLNADEAATVTLAAPPRAMSWASSRPVGPAPKTRAELPGRRASVSVPCMAHAVGSVNTEMSGSMPSTEKTRLAGTVTYSANEPGQFVPSPLRLAHSKVRPVRQYSQCPQFMFGLTETYSPTRNPSVPSPSASTGPMSSCPGVSGNSAKNLPLWMWRSVPQIPVWRTRTRTSPGSGSGVGMSLIAKLPGAS